MSGNYFVVLYTPMRFLTLTPNPKHRLLDISPPLQTIASFCPCSTISHAPRCYCTTKMIFVASDRAWNSSQVMLVLCLFLVFSSLFQLVGICGLKTNNFNIMWVLIPCYGYFQGFFLWRIVFWRLIARTLVLFTNLDAKSWYKFLTYIFSYSWAFLLYLPF